VAAVATVCATVLGTLIALALSRYRFKGSGAVNLFLVLPLTSPEIVLGSSLATLFLARGVERGFLTVVIAHIMFQVSFVAVTLRARIRGFDWTLEQAAMDLGASPQRAFWKVTFPLILPGILAAALLSLHHHVLQRRLTGDIPTASIWCVTSFDSTTIERAGFDVVVRQYCHHGWRSHY
jgi:spermidine/putrescine transport system permease protein